MFVVAWPQLAAKHPPSCSSLPTPQVGQGDGGEIGTGARRLMGQTKERESTS